MKTMNLFICSSALLGSLMVLAGCRGCDNDNDKNGRIGYDTMHADSTGGRQTSRDGNYQPGASTSAGRALTPSGSERSLKPSPFDTTKNDPGGNTGARRNNTINDTTDLGTGTFNNTCSNGGTKGAVKDYSRDTANKSTTRKPR